jgi:saccharopine dehydrogenase-like NADP-dependent oxidoreductase
MKNRVLILGAGLVSKPMIEYLLEKGFNITVASPIPDRAAEMVAGNPTGTVVDWSMEDTQGLDRMVSEHDLTVSLLPYSFHLAIAKVCLKHRKHLVTASYIQPGMMEMDDDVRKAGIIILNEVGLDPGIDHMSAMRVIDKIKTEGGQIEEFYSLCGALPAPESNDNPFGYKFSWSPKGVVLASRNGAHYLKHGREVNIEPVNLFKDRFCHSFPGVGELEVYPNRDSISFIDIYGLKGIRTMYRGTFRFPGWCEALDLIKGINLIGDEKIDYTGMSYRKFLCHHADIKGSDIEKELKDKPGLRPTGNAIKSLEWLGLFSDEPMGYGITSSFEITSDLMIKKMWLNDDDRDMIVMQHLFLAKHKDGSKEVISSRMLDFGSPATNTSIARTVALPAAMAVKQILEGGIKLRGVYRPVLPEIYNPILDELEKAGIKMEEEYGLPVETIIS